MRFSVLEPVLSLARFVTFNLRRMLLCVQNRWQVRTFVEDSVVVFLKACAVDRRQITGATISRTDAANVMDGQARTRTTLPDLARSGQLDPQPAGVEPKCSVCLSGGKDFVGRVATPIVVP